MLRRLRRATAILGLARDLAPLGESRRSRLWIAALTVYLGSLRLLRRPLSGEWELRLVLRGQRRQVRLGDYGELQVLRDIFVRDEYLLDLDPAPDVILDLGSNIGLSILYFRSCWPAAQIYGVEPEPRVFERLEANVGGDSGTRLFKRAVTETSGEVRLFRPAGYSVAASLSRGRDASGYASVEGTALDELLEEADLNSVDLLKLDIEGAEGPVLGSFRGLDRVRTIVGEFHPLASSWSREDFFSLLDRFDVTVIEESAESVLFIARRAGSYV